MSVKVAPPFKLALRLAEDAIPNADETGLEKLRDVVAGKDRSFPRSAAMALLLTSDFPNKDEDFAAVLEDEKAPARIRFLAATTLAKIHTRAARNMLIKNLSVRDDRVRAGVLVGLGRIGDGTALKAIENLKEDSNPARFAATLIAHRLGLEGHDLPVPDDKDLINLPAGDVSPVQWQRPAANDVSFCLRSLASNQFGIALVQEPAYQVRCGRRDLMVLFNRELIAQGTIKRVSERKTLAGVVALRNGTNGLYSVSLLIMTSPNMKNGAIHISLCHTNGDIAYAGRVVVKENSAEFSLRSVLRAGASPIRFEGIFHDGRLEVKTALSGQFVISRQHPRQGLSPETPNAD